MQVVLLLWLLAGAALTASNPTPIDTTASVARPSYPGSGHPAVVSSPSGAAYPAISTYSSDGADPTGSSSSSGAAYPAVSVSSSGVADSTGSSSSFGAAYPVRSVSSSGVADSTGSSSSFGAAYSGSSASSSGVADPTGSAFSSQDEAVYGVRSSDETTSKNGRVPAPAEDLADSSESEEGEEEEEDEEDDDDTLPADEDIDARSIFAALVNDDDDDDEDGDSHREARLFALNNRDVSSRAAPASQSSASAKDGQRAVSDSSTIAKYNHFIDVFFRRVNSELRANAEPVEISLSKKGRKNGKKKNGKGKKGNKSKKEKRHPRDFNHNGFNETDDHLQEKEVPVDDDDDDAESDEDDTTEISAGSSRQSKDIEFEDEAEDDQDLAEERDSRGIGMEKRRTEAKKNNPNRSSPAKSGKQRKNNKNKRSGNKGKKRKNGKKKRKGGKKRAGGKKKKKNKKNKNKNKNKKENRGRSRDSEEESDLSITQGGRRMNSGMESRKRKDEKHNSKGSGDNSEKHKKGKKNNKKNKKGKKGKKNKANNADTQASVTGISSLIRDGDVNVTQSSDTQKISSHFLLGPVSVHLARRFSDGEAKTAVSTASLRGTVVIEVNRSGRAKITKLKLSKPSNVTTEGSLRSDDSKKKANKTEKILKTSIKKVSPQISKQIENTARAVLDTTSRAVRS